jgi:hypothetical protein
MKNATVQSLTKKQRELVKELDSIAQLLDIDYHNTSGSTGSDRTIHLQVIRDQMIRGQIIMYYTLVDEVLSDRICRFFFPRKYDSIRLWKTKRFQLFNYHVIEELSLLKKLAFVKSIMKVPGNISEEIQRLNSLRNGIAHSFYPQNLRKSKPLWKGQDIFTFEGIRSMVEDMEKVFILFRSR